MECVYQHSTNEINRQVLAFFTFGHFTRRRQDEYGYEINQNIKRTCRALKTFVFLQLIVTWRSRRRRHRPSGFIGKNNLSSLGI